MHSLVLTDIARGWTETAPIVVREGSLVVETLERVRAGLPFALRALDVDNVLNASGHSLSGNRHPRRCAHAPRRPGGVPKPAYAQIHNRGQFIQGLLASIGTSSARVCCDGACSGRICGQVAGVAAGHKLNGIAVTDDPSSAHSAHAAIHLSAASEPAVRS